MTRARWARVTGLSGPFPAACHRLISRRAGSVAGTVLAVPGCGAAAGTASGPQAYLDAERRRHPVPRLTPRQNELLRLLASGRTNSRIAHSIGISEGTVRTHLENIYEKLGVSSRTAARHPRLPRPGGVDALCRRASRLAATAARSGRSPRPAEPKPLAVNGAR